MSGEIKIIRLRTLQDILQWWNFLREGVEQINDGQPWDEARLPEETLFKRFLHLTELRDDEQLMVVFTDELNNPLGYGVAYDSTPRFYKRTLKIFCGYSNHKSPLFSRQIFNHIEKWAKENNYHFVTFSTARTSGATYRVFERKYKYRRLALTFFKEL